MNTKTPIGLALCISAVLAFASSGHSACKLVSADVLAPGTHFGDSLAVDGDTLVAGAPSDSAGGITLSGSAYVFMRSGDCWVQQAKLTAADAGSLDSFGNSAAISGDTIVVGSFGDTHNGIRSGSAYVFVRNGASFIQQQKLLPNDPGEDDEFGNSVAISGDTILVSSFRGILPPGTRGGNPGGSVYVFVRQGGVWTQQQRIVRNGAQARDGGLFGSALAIDGDTFIAGEPSATDPSGTYYGAGAAYFFTRNNGVWAQQQRISPTENGKFGYAVALNGGRAVVGTPFASDTAMFDGSAFVFARNGTTWELEQKLTPSDPFEQRIFGTSVAIEGDRIFVGAPGSGANHFSTAGAYLFERTAGGWSQTKKAVPEVNLPEGRGFASKVGVSGDNLVVANPMDNTSRGAVYVFPPHVPAVLNCPEPVVVECNPGAGTLTTVVSDPDGNPLTLLWLLNGAPLQTNHVGATAGPATFSFAPDYPLGSNLVSLILSDGITPAVTCSTSVTVTDTTPPTIARITATPALITDAHPKWVPVTINVTSSDNCGAVRCKILSVESSDPIRKGPDWIITGDLQLLVRAEPPWDGRTYTIQVQCRDEAGNTSTGTVQIKVLRKTGRP